LRNRSYVILLLIFDFKGTDLFFTKKLIVNFCDFYRPDPAMPRCQYRSAVGVNSQKFSKEL